MLGGVSKGWRFDWMPTVHDGPSGEVNKDFSASARHYGTPVTVCPPHSGHRKGVVKKNHHSGAQHGWPTVEHKTTFEQAVATYESVGPLAVPYPVILRNASPAASRWLPGSGTTIRCRRISPPRRSPGTPAAHHAVGHRRGWTGS